MLKEIKKFTLQVIAGANIATILMMLLVGYSDRLNPVSHPLFANLGLGFPIFVFINFCFLVFWLVFKYKGALISIAGFIVCFVPVRTYCPLNVGTDIPEDGIKVLSYNVWLFAGWEGKKSENPIVDYIQKQDADIVCLQEAATNEVGKVHVDSVLNPIYAYRDTATNRPGGDVIALYSKYPIISREHIYYESKGNLSMAWTLKIDGDTVIVINNHLETTGLSKDEKSDFKQLVKGDMDRDAAEHTSRRLVDKLGEASAKRAPQADAVARFIKNHSGESIILCGDFNDSPISYTHHTLADLLTDCFVESGNGLGISYHHSGFYVRIDNIMCSQDWEPHKCMVDNKIKNSDHYPIICWLKKRGK